MFSSFKSKENIHRKKLGHAAVSAKLLLEINLYQVFFHCKNVSNGK